MSVEVTELANGFRIVTDRMEGLFSASVGVWVGVGGRWERDDQTGLSHFLEHMAFKGTRRRNALDIVESIESVGGFINAYTSRERTAYFARMLGEHVPLAIDIIGDVLRESRLAEEDVERERGVILQEIAQSLDTPEEVVDDWLYEVAYPDQPMGRTLLGPASLIRTLSAEDLRGYLSELYRPGRMVLAAAGAVEHAAIVAQAESLFGDLEPGESDRKSVPARYRGGERRQEKELEQAHIALGLEAPGSLDSDRHAARVYAVILGGGMSSRLFQELREKRGLCYAVAGYSVQYGDTGLFGVDSGTGGEQVDELVRLAVEQMRAVADDATEAETARVRTQMRAALVMGLESPRSRCERMASGILTHGRVIPTEETLAEIEAVTRDRVREVGSRILAGSELSYACYGKVGSAPDRSVLQGMLAC